MTVENPRKRLVILGSTGSIGRTTLQVVEESPERFQVLGLAAGSDFTALAEQSRKFRPAYVAVADADAAAHLRARLDGTGVSVLEGPEGVADLATLEGTDLVVSAIVGGAGLIPTYRAVENGIAVALANKEPLVMAGKIITRLAARTGSVIIPVDSEHHALSMAMRGIDRDGISHVTITASGGPFREIPADELARVTVEQALRHPRWRMGSKITIDSATLMNKGLEIIEAHWLFGFEESRIRALIHPESIVHGMVHLVDGGVLAYLSVPDMKIPIAAALNQPRMLPADLPQLDLEEIGRLRFFAPDHERFPALNMAREALRAGGTAPAVLNAANEVAVRAFLDGRLGFTGITDVTRRVLDETALLEDDSLEAVMEQDRLARAAAARHVDTRGGRPGVGGSERLR